MADKPSTPQDVRDLRNDHGFDQKTPCSLINPKWKPDPPDRYLKGTPRLDNHGRRNALI